jgi:hypothetical protein
MPGLETVAGTLHRDAASATIRLELTARDLTPWITSPRLALQAGDVVHLDALANPNGVCPDLKAIPATQDIRIQAVEPRALVLDPGGHDGFPAFNVSDGCGNVLVGVDVRTGPSPAGDWLVVAGRDVRGRVAHDAPVPFVAKAQRFDYPTDLPAARPQVDIEVAFSPRGPLPLLAGQQFTFSTARGTQPTTIKETLLFLQGPVGDVFTYQSAHFDNGSILSPNILFTALTGNNALLRASPATLGPQSPASLLVYR